MNTLSRQYTRTFFPQKTEYTTFHQHWSELVNSPRKHKLKAVHHLTYLVLTGKDWRKAFTFPTNSNKLKNGYQPELYRALAQFNSGIHEKNVLEPFDGLVTPETLASLRKLLTAPKISPGGKYLSDAYFVPNDLPTEEK